VGARTRPGCLQAILLEIFRSKKHSCVGLFFKKAATLIIRLSHLSMMCGLSPIFGCEAFNMKDFWATEAALVFVTVAYNLMSVFRMFVLQEKTQRTLSTLRFRVFAIGAYFQKINGNLVLIIALTKKRRRWFADLWNYPLKLPLLSNA
jgi:hypothetical protein